MLSVFFCVLLYRALELFCQPCYVYRYLPLLPTRLAYVFFACLYFLSCLFRFVFFSVLTTVSLAYVCYLLEVRHDGGYYAFKDCVTFFFSTRRRHTNCDFSSDVCSSVPADPTLLLVAANQNTAYEKPR